METKPQPLMRLQACCAGAIAELWELNGRSPTLAELQRELDMASVHEVRHTLMQLEMKGWLDMQKPGEPLCIRMRVRDVPVPGDRDVEVTPAGLAAMAAHEAA